MINEQNISIVNADTHMALSEDELKTFEGRIYAGLEVVSPIYAFSAENAAQTNLPAKLKQDVLKHIYSK
jgi:hypothetical protein